MTDAANSHEPHEPHEPHDGTADYPRGVLDARYGEPEARAPDWRYAVRLLDEAQVFWLTTLRAGGAGPHVTPLLAVWSEDALHFCTGAGEQKARNLAADRRVALTTGANALHAGCDLVVEGEAVRVTDAARLRHLAAAWEAKYGAEWRFDVREDAAGDGVFGGEHGNVARVFAVAPVRAYGFGKAPYSQTRWTFGARDAARTPR
ncbi:pyridoxamine 5'-phosphate oxidase family protein [Streptomyces sp. 8L]|uniref:pyridoxamine 5'-phosphate oxidase family protein n=1 Tax=Streptomyces sp. 8L TaxID=2877242 RepID=UPI001CD586EE|nr:pyridoxamine 5'-phosphate oxidase family protein [Streptomyces sp. 8L]MCA1219954.1 pyridoxamine 5'-phosphate oxidase family protein [Streptomyces sp. 8L]